MNKKEKKVSIIATVSVPHNCKDVTFQVECHARVKVKYLKDKFARNEFVYLKPVVNYL